MHLLCMKCTTSSSLSITRRVGGFRLDSRIRRLEPGRCWPAPAAQTEDASWPVPERATIRELGLRVVLFMCAVTTNSPSARPEL